MDVDEAMKSAEVQSVRDGEPMYLVRPGGRGDYERIRISGMSEHLSRKDGLIQLERCGPFIPPMSMPSIGDIVVTDAMLTLLRDSSFSEWTVLDVIKAHIRLSNWPDTLSNEDVGEPEDAVLAFSHNPECAASMGDLRELVLPTRCVASRMTRLTNDGSQYELLCISYTGGDLFFTQLPGGRAVLCSSNFKNWLESLDGVSQWLRFIPIFIRES